MPVVWRTRALADIAHIQRYIATDNPVAAVRVAKGLLAVNPAQGSLSRWLHTSLSTVSLVRML